MIIDDVELLGSYIHSLNQRVKIKNLVEGGPRRISEQEAFKIAKAIAKICPRYKKVPIELVISSMLHESAFTDDLQKMIGEDIRLWHLGLGGLSIFNNLRSVYGRAHTNDKIYEDAFSGYKNIENMFKNLNRCISVFAISGNKFEPERKWQYIYNMHRYDISRAKEMDAGERKMPAKTKRVVESMYSIAESFGESAKSWNERYA